MDVNFSVSAPIRLSNKVKRKFECRVHIDFDYTQNLCLSNFQAIDGLI